MTIKSHWFPRQFIFETEAGVAASVSETSVVSDSAVSQTGTSRIEQTSISDQCSATVAYATVHRTETVVVSDTIFAIAGSGDQLGTDSSPAQYSVVLLVELYFVTGTIRYTAWPEDLTIPSLGEFTGLAGLTSVSPIGASEAQSEGNIQLNFTVVSAAMLAASVGNTENYRRRKVKIYTQLLDSNYRLFGTPKLRWVGKMDRIRIPRRSPNSISTPGTSGSIVMECLRSGMDRYRNSDALRVTEVQHVKRFPGDKGLEYLNKLVQEPALWLSKKFQEI